MLRINIKRNGRKVGYRLFDTDLNVEDSGSLDFTTDKKAKKFVEDFFDRTSKYFERNRSLEVNGEVKRIKGEGQC